MEKTRVRDDADNGKRRITKTLRLKRATNDNEQRPTTTATNCKDPRSTTMTDENNQRQRPMTYDNAQRQQQRPATLAATTTNGNDNGQRLSHCRVSCLDGALDGTAQRAREVLAVLVGGCLEALQRQGLNLPRKKKKKKSKQRMHTYTDRMSVTQSDIDGDRRKRKGERKKNAQHYHGGP